MNATRSYLHEKMKLMIRSLFIILKRLLLPIRIRFALRGKSELFIVEVGANDGKSGDPLFHLIRQNPQCKALLVEPVPYLFERLSHNYKGLDRVVLANVAIAASAGQRPIFHIDPSAREVLPNLPPYFEELASFDREKVASLLGKDSIFLKEQQVQTIGLDALIHNHQFEHVDLLQIDTEGYDYEVLKTFPFDRIRPVVVCFEHSHLGELERQEARTFMTDRGYSIEGWGKDFLCVVKN